MDDIAWESLEHNQVLQCHEHGARNGVAVCSVCAGLARVLATKIEQEKQTADDWQDMASVWRRRAERAERERDAANNLLHGLTTEDEANAAWKALVLRAEQAERERDEAREQADEARREYENYAEWVAENSQVAEARVAELEAALREIAEKDESGLTCGQVIAGMRDIARAALAEVEA